METPGEKEAVTCLSRGESPLRIKLSSEARRRLGREMQAIDRAQINALRALSVARPEALLGFCRT